MHNAPSFRGTDRLKFTAAEQELIRATEREQGYHSEGQAAGEPARMLVKAFLWIIGALFLTSIVVGMITGIGNALSRSLKVQAQGLRAEANISQSVKDERAPRTPDREKTDNQSLVTVQTAQVAPATPQIETEVVPETPSQTDAESQETDSGPSPREQTSKPAEGEPRVEFVSMNEALAIMKEKGYLSDLAEHFQRQLWTEVEAENETLLLEEPRFDAPLLAHIAPGVRYSVIDMHLRCSQIVDLTWKFARIRVKSSQSSLGLVCTPKQAPQSSSFGPMSFTDSEGKVIFQNGR